MSGQTKISGLTLREFEELEALLDPLIEAEGNPFSCALLVVEAINDADDKAEALSEIAVKYAETGQKDKAAQILSQALETVKSIEDADDKGKAFFEVTESYAKIGQPDKAFQMLRFQAYDYGVYSTTNSAYKISGVLREIASSYAKAGQKEKATQTFSQAIEAAQNIKDGWSKNSALELIVLFCADAGYFVQTLKTAKTIKDESGKLRALFLVLEYADANQLTQALETTKSMKGGLWKARVLYKIAAKYSETGQKDKATQILSQALETAKLMKGGRWKASVLSEIAVTYSETGQKDKAVQILSQALETAKTIEDADDKAETLLGIAGSYAKAGQKEKAAQILSQALETAQTIKVVKGKLLRLGEIADEYSKVGQEEMVAQILSQEVEILVMVLGRSNQKSDVYLHPDFSSLLTDIAVKYANVGQQPNEDAITYLREIVQAVKPIRITLAWE
jgi:tetratricopeptide (TPR) repeat protein